MLDIAANSVAGYRERVRGTDRRRNAPVRRSTRDEPTLRAEHTGLPSDVARVGAPKRPTSKCAQGVWLKGSGA